MKISVSTCQDNPLDVVVNAPTTAHMNVLTSDSVISFYPTLTFGNKGLRVEGVEQVLGDGGREASRDVNMVGDNASWTLACNRYCPSIWRKPFYDDGIATYPWESGVVGDNRSWNWEGFTNKGEAFLKTKILMWRVKLRCANPNCEHHLHYEERKALGIA
jgi:hypothetical protein